MKKTIVAFSILTAVALNANPALAANGLFGQPGTAPTNQATDYDVLQDQQYQIAVGLTQNAISHTQTNAQGINTVAQGVQQNAQAIGQTNASIGQTNQNLQSLTTNVGQNAQAIGQTNALVAQNTQGVQQLTQQANTQAQQTGQLAGQVGKNTQGVQTLTTQVGQNTSAIQQQQQVSGNFATKPELDTTNKKVAGNASKLQNHEQRISNLESLTFESNKRLEHEVHQNRRRASAAISSVAALAGIPQVMQDQTFFVGAGVGATDGESALAVGGSARINQNWVVQAGVSSDSQHNFTVNGGFGVGF